MICYGNSFHRLCGDTSSIFVLLQMWATELIAGVSTYNGITDSLGLKLYKPFEEGEVVMD